MLRYHRSLNHKLYRLRIGSIQRSALETLREIKELTEGHHQEWSLRLNLTQHGKTYQRDFLGIPKGSLRQ
eukprot:maker-scaffold_151-snap-gene-0.4-mRNA-1 protein AED:0.47 eAED:0.73 QI:0/0/0/1/0/0/3/0/69